MTEAFQEDLKFEAADNIAGENGALILDIDGYEGPLHLLLELARKQKVDLARVSILELADQYISFIKNAEDLRIELAADYLVMAAWLAYLKSRLILPKATSETDMEAPDDIAAHLAFRLQRLEAMRRAADGLVRLPIQGRNVLMRGSPEGLRSRTTPLWEAKMFDLIAAYGGIRSRTHMTNTRVKLPKVMTLEEARQRLRRSLNAMGMDDDWQELEGLVSVSDAESEDLPKDSIRASTLVAGLELAKEGQADMRQGGTFTPIYIRGKKDNHE